MMLSTTFMMFHSLVTSRTSSLTFKCFESMASILRAVAYPLAADPTPTLTRRLDMTVDRRIPFVLFATDMSILCICTEVFVSLAGRAHTQCRDDATVRGAGRKNNIRSRRYDGVSLVGA